MNILGGMFSNINNHIKEKQSDDHKDKSSYRDIADRVFSARACRNIIHISRLVPPKADMAVRRLPAKAWIKIFSVSNMPINPFMKFPILLLPKTICSNIISQLDIQDIISLSMVCTTTKKMVDDNYDIYYNKLTLKLLPVRRATIENIMRIATDKYLVIWMHQFYKSETMAKQIVKDGPPIGLYNHYWFELSSMLMDYCKIFTVEKEITIIAESKIGLILFSNDSSHILTMSDDNKATIYSYSSNSDYKWEKSYSIETIHTFKSGSISFDARHIAISISHSNATLGDKTIKIYSINLDGTWTNTGSLGEEFRSCIVNFIPNSNHLMAHGKNHKLIFYRKYLNENGSLAWSRINTIIDDVDCALASFSSNGKRMLATSIPTYVTKILTMNSDGMLIEEASIDNCLIYHLSVYEEKITLPYFNDDGDQLAMPTQKIGDDEDYPVQIYSRDQLQTWTMTSSMIHNAMIESLALKRINNKQFLIIKDRLSVHFYSMSLDGIWSNKLKIRYNDIGSFTTFSADYCHMAMAPWVNGENDDNNFFACIYSLDHNAEKWTQVANIFHLGPMINLTFSLDGRNLVTHSADGEIQVYGRNSQNAYWTKKTTIDAETVDGSQSPFFSNDSRYVITNDCNNVTIWSLSLKECFNGSEKDILPPKKLGNWSLAKSSFLPWR